jgi:Cu+-exporting ATPase
MFNLFKKKPTGTVITLKLNGLHCASCSLNIDDALEETKGVMKSSTNYGSQSSVIEYDPTKVDVKALRKIIEAQGYQVLS